MLCVSTVARMARDCPADVALVDIERRLSWSQLAEGVARAAAYLRGHELRRGDRIGLALGDDADFVIVLVAALQIGLVVTPMDWRCKLQERQAMLSGFRLRALIIRASAAAGQPRHIAWPMPASQPPLAFAEPAAPDEPCMIMLSSGTTGAPSGAVISRAALEHRLTAGGDAIFGLGGHRYLSFLPLCFASGISQVLRNLTNGNAVFIQPAMSTAHEMIDAVQSLSPTYIGIVPAMLRSLLRLTDAELAGLAKLRAIRVGGSAMTVEERQSAKRRIGVPVYHSYGTSAFGTLCHWSSIDPHLPPDSIGKPYPWVELRIVDSCGKVQGPGQIGLLECRGPSLAAELLSIDGAVSPLRGQWYAPGDLAQLDEGGNLLIVGRATDVIDQSGVKVYPELVEKGISAHPAVQDVAVVGRLRDGMDDLVAAFVVLRTPVAVEELFSHCRIHLSSKYRPAEIHIVAELPRTTSGKVKRHELRGPAARGVTPLGEPRQDFVEH